MFSGIGLFAETTPGLRGPVNLNDWFFFFACYYFDIWHNLCTGHEALKHSWEQKKDASKSICLQTGHCIVAFLPQPGVQHFS